MQTPRFLRAAAVAGALTAAAMLMAGCAAAEPATTTTDAATTDAAAARAASVEQGIVIGDGAVEVVMFGDASCPYCAALEASIGDALAERLDAGEITLVLHPMTYVSAKHGDETEYSTRAAALMWAAADAGEADDVPAFYALTLEHQPGDGETAPTDDDLLAYAAEAGVEADLSDALTGDAFRDLATEASEYWLGRSIPGTSETLQYVPTIAVDGTIFEMRGDGTDLERLTALLTPAS